MKLFVLLFVSASNAFLTTFGKLHEDNAIENLHIDMLVQRYMFLESDLWNYVYNSGAKTKDIILKIRSDHGAFLSSSGLSDVMNDDYKAKFGRFLNFTEFENYAQEDSQLIALAERPHGMVRSESYGTSATVIDIYNRIISNDLFKVIKEVSKSVVVLKSGMWFNKPSSSISHKFPKKTKKSLTQQPIAC